MKSKDDKKWKLINLNTLPKDSRGFISYKDCIGIVLKYKYEPTGLVYNIKILDYIKGYKDDNNKRFPSKFNIKYIYLRNTNCEEIIYRNKMCESLILHSKIGDIIPSLNQWIKEEGYWVGVDGNGKKFKFSTNNKETEYKILHSTWYIGGNNYISTGSLNNSGQSWRMHKAIYFNCNKEEADKNVHMCIDHINNDRADNRVENLRLVTKAENNKNFKTNNKYGLVGFMQYSNKKWGSQFRIENFQIYTEMRIDKSEAELDNLISQQYLGFKHNEDQFWRIEHLPEERIKEVTDLLDKKIENNKHKTKKEKEYYYNYIERDNLIGIKTFKKDGTENPICWVDGDFGKIEGDKLIIKNNIRYNKKYFNINNIMLSNFIIMNGISLCDYRGNNFHIDHINRKTNENYRDNLEIVTIRSNMMNKEGEGYNKIHRKNKFVYNIQYGYKWKYFDLYIGGLKLPYFNTEEEAIAEVKRRKEIVDKYRFRVKTKEELDEVIDFAEEHELDVDSAYIIWSGLDSLENIKNFLKTIDK